MRIAKLRSSVDVFLKGGHAHAQLDHLTLMEINTVRPFLPHALDQIFRLKQVCAVFCSCLISYSSGLFLFAIIMKEALNVSPYTPTLHCYAKSSS